MFSRAMESCVTKFIKKQFRNSSSLNTLKTNSIIDMTKYKTLTISVPKQFVYMVQLNRPEKHNALNGTMWQEIKQCFDELSIEPECRTVVLSAIGKTFCAGIDFHDMIEFGQSLGAETDVARKCKALELMIKKYQDSFTAIEKCSKPVITAVSGACIGAGIDMISAADIRYCTSEAWFQIKEVDLGLAADVGTLQRFPKIIGSDSFVRELVYTARKFSATEALEQGFVNRVFDNTETLLKTSIDVAEQIAKKSPVAIQGSKISLIYSRDHSVQEGLDHIALRNQAMLQSEDFIKAVTSQLTKDSVVFSKL